ncbi:centromere protein I-like [Copidosoma floridanum]|uniref:centromere protein I-like n=1 Tax=Copidosoma floridanum TaxID=29053 RepID=UPI0006C94C28|nr:centromere protein I-like [Copidosoma floridanum]
MDKTNQTEDHKIFLRKLRQKGKALTDFRVSVNKLQDVASSKGLDEDTLKLLLDVLKRADLSVQNCVILIKCMIPREKLSDILARQIITWFLTLSVSVTALNTLLQWFIGCLEYQLINKNSLYIFYDPFFFIMIKEVKLQSRLAQLIYLLTKPEDVTRRQVSRLLKIKEINGRPQKHLIALLLLFKSYKPEFVPEEVPAINVQSIWAAIPEILRLGFEDARDRTTLQQSHTTDEFNCKWTIFPIGRTKKNQEPLIPSIGYFNIGSSIFNEKTERSIFDVSSYIQLGQYHFDIKLPSKATSLLSNSIGYHLLTYADVGYQQRFMYNLYYTLWKSFIYENGGHSNEEMNKILDMTIEFSKYMQHGISIVNYFINEYLSCYMDEHHVKLLPLMQWSTVLTTELQDYVLKHMKLMFHSSSLSDKIKIMKTVKLLLVNLFVANNDLFKDKYFPFLGQSFDGKLIENMQIICKFSKELIMSAINIHHYDLSLLSEALSFYEQVHLLEVYNGMNITLAPSAVIYGCFVTKSCALLSRVCSLLLQYRKCFKENKNRASARNIKSLIIYAEDLVSALWYDKCFSDRSANNRYFLKLLSDDAIDSCQLTDIDSLLNIKHHYAVLPYVYTLNTSGLLIKSKKDANSVAAQYYGHISQFITALLGN